MTETSAELRNCRIWIYLLLMATAMGSLLARIGHVTARDGQTPFLSANDRSRWAATAALLEYGSFEIDEIIQRRGWDTIDKVSHLGRDGQQHYYSSKPPILSVALAGITATVERTTGRKLVRQPFFVGRIVLAVTNGTLLLVFFYFICRSVECWGTTTVGKVFVVACATWGTLLTTFGITINNHLPAATATMISFYALLRIWYDDQRRWWLFVLAGLGAACAAACELPAVALLLGVIVALWLKSPSLTLKFGLPSALLVGVAFFAMNYAAHDQLRPPYAHRQSNDDWRGNNWYNYPGSYWYSDKRSGVDLGEPSLPRYAFNVVLGHHGVLSLTPVWLLSLAGTVMLARRKHWWAATLAVVALTLACLVFYIFLRPLGDRNYGGVCCGFRWLLWLVPLWLVAMLPAADWLCPRPRLRWVAVALLIASVFSATYPTLNPWTHPWIYQYWQALGWPV